VEHGRIGRFWANMAFGLSSAVTCRPRGRAAIAGTPTRRAQSARGPNWRCRYGGIKYEVDFTGFPEELENQVKLIMEGSGFDDLLTEAVYTVVKYRADFPAVRVVLVDSMCLKNLRTVRIARDALMDVVEERDIPAILKPFKGLNYSAQAECLQVLAKLGSPKVHKFVEECAIDHQIPRIRRCSCGCLAATRYTDAEEANSAFSTLLDLTTCEDWSVRYAALVSLEKFRSTDLVQQSLKDKVEAAFRARASEEEEDQIVVRTKASLFLNSSVAVSGSR